MQENVNKLLKREEKHQNPVFSALDKFRTEVITLSRKRAMSTSELQEQLSVTCLFPILLPHRDSILSYDTYSDITWREQ